MNNINSVVSRELLCNKMRDEMQKIESFKCSICLSKVLSPDQSIASFAIQSLQCGHRYHAGCNKAWEAFKGNACPCEGWKKNTSKKAKRPQETLQAYTQRAIVKQKKFNFYMQITALQLGHFQRSLALVFDRVEAREAKINALDISPSRKKELKEEISPFLAHELRLIYSKAQEQTVETENKLEKWAQ